MFFFLREGCMEAFIDLCLANAIKRLYRSLHRSLYGDLCGSGHGWCKRNLHRNLPGNLHVELYRTKLNGNSVCKKMCKNIV